MCPYGEYWAVPSYRWQFLVALRCEINSRRLLCKTQSLLLLYSPFTISTVFSLNQDAVASNQVCKHGCGWHGAPERDWCVLRRVGNTKTSQQSTLNSCEWDSSMWIDGGESGIAIVYLSHCLSLPLIFPFSWEKKQIRIRLLENYKLHPADCD